MNRLLNNEDKLIHTVIVFASILIIFSWIYVISYQNVIEPNVALWILDKDHSPTSSEMDVYVFNNYTYVIGINNNVPDNSEYKLVIKLRDFKSDYPNTTTKEPSNIRYMFNDTYFKTISDGYYAEKKYSFSFLGYKNNTNFIIYKISFNNLLMTYYKEVPLNNFEKYEIQLIFELWEYDSVNLKYYFTGIWVSSPKMYLNELYPEKIR